MFVPRSLFLTGSLLFTSLLQVASAQVFDPLSLAPSSFNHDVVVEVGATAPLTNSVTATMDGGTSESGATY